MKKSNNKYRFGEEKQVSLGSMVLGIYILQTILITELIDVVHANVSLVIRLIPLDKYDEVYIINVKNILYCLKLSIKIPLQRKHGHMYIFWRNKSRIQYTRTELVKIHKNIFIPCKSNKLFKLLKLARP